MSDWLGPYITFNGNCETAVKFHQTVLDGEAKIMHFIKRMFKLTNYKG
jgi:PhnB protein